MLEKQIKALNNLSIPMRLLILATALGLIKFFPEAVVKTYVGIITIFAFYYLFRLAKGFYLAFKQTEIKP